MREKASSIIWAFSDRSINAGSPVTSKKTHIQNRKTFLQKLGINYEDLVCAEQVHKAEVAVVTKSDKGKIILGKDALITKEENLAIAVFTADCLPVFLCDNYENIIALVHSGWRGTRLGIVKKTIEIMKKEFKAKSKNMYACFGPSIKKCCYEVGSEFKDYFSSGLIKRDNKIFLDLVEINKQYILESGLEPKRILDANICTSCRNNEFFSYRKEGKNCGRTMSVMMVRGY